RADRYDQFMTAARATASIGRFADKHDREMQRDGIRRVGGRLSVGVRQIARASNIQDQQE
ncbi:MAG TPA: hypothetical protein VI140_04145, partial [Oxalicibacterium sp.]